MKMRTGNKQLIRDINTLLIINEIRRNSPISRTDISRNLKLGLSTVTNIIEELKQQNYVIESGEADSTGGRKPITLAFNFDYGCTIGIKIAEDYMMLALTNLKVKIVYKTKIEFEKSLSSGEVLEKLISAVKMVIKKIPQDKKLLGIGIAVSGLIDQENGQLIFSGMLNWHKTNIGSILEDYFNVPVFVDNNVNVYALAELWQGKGRDLKDFAVVTFGSGIGCGIVLNHKLYRGNFGGAGEIGHMIIDVGGRECECGNKGCLEAYASEKAVADYIKDNIKHYKNSIIDLNDELTFEKIYSYALKGDKLAVKGLERSAKYLAYGILNIINVLNPSSIILAGEGLIAKDIFVPIIQDIIKDNFFKQHDKKIKLIVSELGNDAWEIGASILVVSKLFEIPLYEEQKTFFIH